MAAAASPPLPLAVMRLTSRYGMRSLHGGAPRMHEGIDLSAPEGTPIRSILAGTVEHAHAVGTPHFSGYGNVTVIGSRTGSTVLHTLYAHQQRPPPVERGQTVEAGDVIGYVGGTSDPGAHVPIHLHLAFSVVAWPKPYNEGNIDPERMLSALGLTFASGRNARASILTGSRMDPHAQPSDRAASAAPSSPRVLVVTVDVHVSGMERIVATEAYVRRRVGASIDRVASEARTAGIGFPATVDAPAFDVASTEGGYRIAVTWRLGPAQAGEDPQRWRAWLDEHLRAGQDGDRVRRVALDVRSTRQAQIDLEPARSSARPAADLEHWHAEHREAPSLLVPLLALGGLGAVAWFVSRGSKITTLRRGMHSTAFVRGHRPALEAKLRAEGYT